MKGVHEHCTFPKRYRDVVDSLVGLGVEHLEPGSSFFFVFAIKEIRGTLLLGSSCTSLLFEIHLLWCLLAFSFVYGGEMGK